MENKKLVLQLAWNGVIYNIYERFTSELYIYEVVKNTAPDVYCYLFQIKYLRYRYDTTTALSRVVDEILRSF